MPDDVDQNDSKFNCKVRMRNKDGRKDSEQIQSNVKKNRDTSR